METLGDILKVIQDGSTRSTQIMHAANLTWPPLMVHLELLLRHQLLTRETEGNRATYRLTAKGSVVLNMYLKLKEETGVWRQTRQERSTWGRSLSLLRGLEVGGRSLS